MTAMNVLTRTYNISVIKIDIAIALLKQNMTYQRRSLRGIVHDGFWLPDVTVGFEDWPRFILYCSNAQWESTRARLDSDLQRVLQCNAEP